MTREADHEICRYAKHQLIKNVEGKKLAGPVFAATGRSNCVFSIFLAGKIKA
jgi:hypothetical protein